MTMSKEKKRVISITAFILLTGSFIHCSGPDELVFSKKTKGSSNNEYEKVDLFTKKIDSDSEKSTTKKMIWVRNDSSSSVLLSYTAVTHRKGDTSKLTQELKAGEFFCIGEAQFVSDISYQELIKESDGCCSLLACCFEPTEKEYTVNIQKKPHHHIIINLSESYFSGLFDTVYYKQEDELFVLSVLSESSRRLLTKSSYEPKNRRTVSFEDK